MVLEHGAIRRGIGLSKGMLITDRYRLVTIMYSVEHGIGKYHLNGFLRVSKLGKEGCWYQMKGNCNTYDLENKKIERFPSLGPHIQEFDFFL